MNYVAAGFSSNSSVSFLFVCLKVSNTLSSHFEI